MTTPSLILALVGGVAAGLGIGLVIARALGLGKSAAAERAAEAEAQKILSAAQQEKSEILKAAQVEGKEIAFKVKAQSEEELRQKRAELTRQEEALAGREKQLERRQAEAARQEAELAKRARSIEGREKAAEAMAARAEQAQSEAKRRLEEIAGLTAEQARQRLADEMVAEARAQVAAEIRQVEEAAEQEAAAKSKQIIATAVQRYASEFVAERTVAVVPLPSDDMKGRLIGREGRNVRALEAAAGIDLIIDDTSEAITISCFNPVRREIGRLAISKLVADGRIHPTRIEEVVAACEKQVEATCQEAGEQAVFDLGLHKVHPELVRYLGRLKFRSSYAQNLLQHSVEVGFLAGLMAAELGLNVKAARRAGLLHDIGKGVDHEQEGSHAEVGAQLARKHGESPRICQAIASHHGDPRPTSVLDHIVEAANQLSAARPGARRELLASYVKRLEDLEKLATSYTGVSRAYALQAGREVRVLVENDKIDDAQARLLSKDIARRIENEATYAGQVRVVVVRETRASDYAR
ncbi:MAG TPA: ribonuclease Y [Kofleriaceae bacterium]|nr:ribonuclease Y [Kofleriaceae bacterium]